MKFIKQIQYWDSPTMVVLTTSDGSGSVRLKKYSEYGYAIISGLYVVADKRRQGIGTALMLEAEKVAGELFPDANATRVTVPSGISKSLFEKLGYTFIFDVGMKPIKA